MDRSKIGALGRLGALCALASSSWGCGLFGGAEIAEELACELTPAGRTERGDGVDNDGDGVVDEGCGCDHQGLALGVCVQGVIEAEGGACARPAYYYAVEVFLCDGLDNDCDGLIDEGCRCTSKGSQIGACALGRVDPIEGTCRQSELLEQEESSCDGYDNDCDGATDEGCPLCEVQATSEGVCQYGRLQGDGSCTPPLAYLEDESEQCADDPRAGDGVDNDCDGVVDEGCECDYRDLPAGVCARAVLGQSGCQAPLGHEIEETLCDGLDNDCDGSIDEACDRLTPPDLDDLDMSAPDLVESDQAELDLGGVDLSRFDMAKADMTSCKASLEVCDSIDNDCDGSIDEEGACEVAFRVTRIESHTERTCALTEQGEVWCWGAVRGDVFSARLARDLFEPTAIFSSGAMIDFALGATFGCALQSDNKVFCWGVGARPLGMTTTSAGALIEESEAPVYLPALDGAVQIDLGHAHGCAVKSNGSLWCWGAHGCAARGLGASDAPARVESWSDVERVWTTSYLTCALRAGGDLWCLGRRFEQPGTACEGDQAPAMVASNVRDVRIGDDTICVETEPDGALSCLGVNYDYLLARLLFSDHAAVMTPIGMFTDASIGAVSIADDMYKEVFTPPEASFLASESVRHQCVLQNDEAICWGRNDFDQLGPTPMSTTHYTAPTAVQTSLRFSRLALTEQRTCGVTVASGEVWCWGQGAGAGGAMPQRVGSLTGVRQLALGLDYGCALTEQGEVWCWGNNARGQVGDPTSPSAIVIDPVRARPSPISPP